MSKQDILYKFIQEVWNEKRLDRIGHYVHPHYKIHLDPNDPWEHKTLDHQEFKVRLNYSFNSFPDIHFHIKHTIVAGQHVAILWDLTGTNTGAIEGEQATNKKIKTSGMTIYHFTGELISGHSQIFDRERVAKQLMTSENN